MILRLLKTNQAYHFILIPLLVTTLWIRSLLFPEFFNFYPGENSMVLYHPIHQLLERSAFANNLLAMVFVIILSFFILNLNTKFAFIRIRTFLLSTIFVLIVSGFLSLHTLHPVYFGLLFLLLAIRCIFHSYDKQKIHANTFDSGFLIGLGSLFYFNLIFYLPITWIGFMVIRKRPDWRNFVLPIIGCFVPWLFTYSYYFLFGDLSILTHCIQQNLFSENNSLQGNIPLFIYLGFLIFLTLPASFFLAGQYDEKKISTRKYFQIFFFISFFSLILWVAVPAVSQEILVIMALPLACLISNYLIFMRRKIWGNVFLYIFIALVIYLQFV